MDLPESVAAESSDELSHDAEESEMERRCRRGRVAGAKVRRHKDRYWELDFSHPGGIGIPRFRRYCKSATNAVRLAIRLTKELKEHGRLARVLSTGQRWVAAQCFRKLAPIHGDDAAVLLAIVDEYLKRHPASGLARSVDAVRKEVVAQKSRLGRSERHVKGLDYKLRCLIKAVGAKPITTVTTDELSAELDRHPDWKPTTVHSAVQSWKILFNYAVRQGYIVENPANRLELPQIVHEEPVVLTVDEARRLLAATLFRDRNPVLPDCRAYLAIGMFAGVRPEEMARLQWPQINLDARTITITGANAKCRVRRIIRVEPVLDRWLRPLARKIGAVLPRPLAELRAAARGVLGLPEWPHDVLRHTFASYHFEKFHDEARTKKQLGHRDDGRIFHNHYCRAVCPADADLFWATFPPIAFLPP
jgi:integrase